MVSRRRDATCVADLVPGWNGSATKDDPLPGALERFEPMPDTMLQRAVEDDCWDVMMVGFNPLNQRADRCSRSRDRRGDRSDVRSAARTEPSG
jgi:hypothetical protein